MPDKDKMEAILDKHMLDFLDGFQDNFGRLPTDDERRIWMSGFVSGCMSIEEAVTGKNPYYDFE